MSLQRRLLWYLLIAAPLVWLVALAVSIDRARHEVNELFDTELIRLARQVQAMPRAAPDAAANPAAAAQPALPEDRGEAEEDDLAIAVWDVQGRRVLADREGVQLPRRADAAGFVPELLDGEPWRVYYLPSPSGLVAVGQKAEERDEVVFELTASQVLPWLLVLPVLMAAMAWAVRQALAPVRELTRDVERREPGDLRPVPVEQTPAELEPLVIAMNGLFGRVGAALARERRFTADAAHELRTPLAVLRAQWDVLRRAAGPAERASAEARFAAGLDRLDRLVTQMLALARVDAAAPLPQPTPIRWPAIVEAAMSDCLPLAERRRIELACEWPPAGHEPLPLVGDASLLTVLTRNLLDNAVRYAPEASSVTLRLAADRLEVENAGAPLAPEQLARLGERFHRPDGQSESGSGLGLSIVQRIAALHGLAVAYGAGDGGRGVRVTLSRSTGPQG